MFAHVMHTQILIQLSKSYNGREKVNIKETPHTLATNILSRIR